jgi:hypothetical protein
MKWVAMQSMSVLMCSGNLLYSCQFEARGPGKDDQEGGGQCESDSIGGAEE